MDETVLFPSPNWFQLSGVAVSGNGWVAYGGPSKGLCLLEPLPSNYDAVIKENPGYKAHVVKGAHPEKIVSVDISPAWPTKKLILAGSSDGSVKQWSVTHENEGLKIKPTHAHNVHCVEKEDIIGVGYSNEEYAISVGCEGNVVKWHINTNIVKNQSYLMKNMKPTCMVCSPHAALNVAVGTKQGVVFVLDLTDKGKIVYKVRAHDDELLYLSWCPQFEVQVKKELRKTSFATARMERIRNEPEPAEGTGSLKKEVTSTPDKAKNKDDDDDDSENETVVEEDDMFDIYKDHEADEFGHKKYQPENIYVKVEKEQEEATDFLAECLKLKQEILNRKSEPEPSIESLVDALDKTHVDTKCDTTERTLVDNKNNGDTRNKTLVDDNKSIENNGAGTEKGGSKNQSVSSVHIHRHLLATIGKLGCIRIWSKSGKQVSQCSISTNVNTNPRFKHVTKPANCLSILWYKPDILLMADGKGQLLMCNALETDAKHKFEWTVVHSLHRRGLFSIVSPAPRRQTAETAAADWPVITSAQDRSIVEYSLKEKRAVRMHATCGGFVYSVAQCPYDARKIAACVGDGAVRVWECDTLEGDERGLTSGQVTSYWQNVQGKVLTIAWHPTRENVLAFATAESRVGIVDTSNRHEKPARLLQSALNSGVYSLSWGEGGRLYASGGGELVMYNVDKPNIVPEPIQVELEGKVWKVGETLWSERALLVGSCEGAVAVMTSSYPHILLAAAFPFTKIIHCIAWHPQQVSSSCEESPHKNLLAVCSNDKVNHIAVLELGEAADGSIRLGTVRTLAGHSRSVMQVAWSPHREELLASTSGDCTVRVWNALEGVCTAIFPGHLQVTLGVCWLGLPSLSDVVVSGGADCSLRMWNIHHYPAEAYVEKKPASTRLRKSKHVKTAKINPTTAKEKDIDSESEEETAIENTDHRSKRASKKFLFPISHRQIAFNSTKACKLLLEKYLEKNLGEKSDNNSLVVTNVNGNRADKIVANVEHIATNSDKIVTNAEKIEINAELIATNADKIATNTEKIATNADKIEANAELIATNADEIEVNAEKIATNADILEEDSEQIAASDEETETNIYKMEENACDFIKMFGSINEVNELLDMELSRHMAATAYESWMCVCMLRGHIGKVFQFASQRDLVCPYLLSMAPCVSAKFWKDVTQMYLAQIDRLVAKGEECKLQVQQDISAFGNTVYRKVWSLLALHETRAAVTELTDANLFKEAYILCRVRYMDSIAEETLRKWAACARFSGKFDEAAACHIVLGDLTEAASVLGKSNREEHLHLAAEIAKLSGQNTFATHMQERTEEIKLQKATEEVLEQLPSRLELLLLEQAKKEDDKSGVEPHLNVQD